MHALFRLCFGHVLLGYVLIYNLEVSFNFNVTFLQLIVIKMFSVKKKKVISFFPAIFFELPITQTCFELVSSFLKGSSYRESTVIP